MTFEQWFTLSNAEQEALKQEWNVYEGGYWHRLNREAVDRFRGEHGALQQVPEISGGVFHGGELIVGVSLDLPHPQTIPLPESYLGFRVVQFCLRPPEPLP